MMRKWGCFAVLICSVSAVMDSYAQNYELSGQHPSYQHSVQAGVGYATVSHSYDLQVPNGFVAKVRVDEAGNGFRRFDCSGGAFVQTVNGSEQALLGKTTEFLNDVRIDLSATAYDPDTSWTEIYELYKYQIANASASFWHYRYHPYEAYRFVCEYTISVSYERLLPDLVASRVELSSSDAAVDETVTLTYSVRNVGRLNATVSTVVRIYDGTKQICGDQTVPPVAAKSALTQTVTLPKLSAGEHTLKVVVDATGTVNEANENNNSETAELRGYKRVPVDVTFDLNGVGTPGERRVVAGNVVGDPLPIVTRRGYEFVGWWTDPVDGYEIFGTEKITRARTFYAHWSAVQSKITLNRQGGGNGDSLSVATFGQTLPRVAVPARVGHAFAGYWTEIGGRGTQCYDSNGKGVRAWDCALSEVTLYAKWIPTDESVVFDQQGGSGGSGSVTATFEAQLPEIVPPARSGWVFQGYYSSPNGEGLKYYDGSGRGVRIWDQLNEKPQSLYAFWLPVQMNYTIGFDLQGGVGDSPETTATFASPLPSVVPPKRDQYVFEGYYSEPNGGGVQYYDAVGESTAKWDLPQNARLYAKWVKAHHVVLDSNGADGSYVTQYFTDSIWRLRKCPFSRTGGLVFAGWALEPDGVPVLADESVVSKALLNLDDDPDADSVTLYAQWGKRLTTSLFLAVEFVTGGDWDGSGWQVEDGVLRSSPLGGRSWLCATFARRGEVRFDFKNSMPRVVTAKCACAGTSCLYSKCCPNSGTCEVRVSSGKRLVTWVCEKKMPTLKNWGDSISMDDPNDLVALLASKESRLDSLTEQFFDVVTPLACAYKSAIWIPEIEQAVRDAIRNAIAQLRSSHAPQYFYETVTSWIADAGQDISEIKKAVRNGTEDGIKMQRLASDIEDTLSDVLALGDFIGGYGMLNDLMVDDVCRVGFVVDNGSEYDKALAADDELKDRMDDLEKIGEQLFNVMAPLACAYRSAIRIPEIEQAVRDAIRNAIAETSYYFLETVTSWIADAGQDISEIKKAVRNGTAEGLAIQSLCHDAEFLGAEIRRLRGLVQDLGVLQIDIYQRCDVLGSLPTPPDRTGYDCKGWWTAPNGGKRVDEKMVVTDDMALYARYELKTFEILFDANGGAGGSRRTVRFGDTLGAADGLPVPTRAGYAFAGWLDARSGEIASVLSLPLDDCVYVAQWTKNTDWAADAVLEYEWHDARGELDGKDNPGGATPKTVPMLRPLDEAPMDAGVANAYGGIIMDADGLPMGYISVKAAKASGKGDARKSKVTVTIQMVGEAKKVTVKGDVDVAEAVLVQSAPDGRVLDLMFTRNSIFGTFDGYGIEGVRNILASTAKSDKGSETRRRAEAIYNGLKGNYVMAYGDENGWNGLSVSIMAKGKVKVSGKLADGTSVSTSSQLIVGEDYSCIPVIYTKKDTLLAFNVYFSNDGAEATVFGYYDAAISPVGGIAGACSFVLGGDFYGLFDEAGYELLEEFLPREVSVVQKGSKWIVADGAKAGQIKLVDGEVVDKKESENPSGLKLTFTAKTGIFKGTFKAYALDGKGKLKSFSATVNGVVVDGYGYGSVTVKKIGSVAVTIE